MSKEQYEKLVKSEDDLKCHWEEQKNPNSTGLNGKLGKYDCFFIRHDYSSRQNGGIKLTCTLPGIKERLGLFDNIEEAQNMANKALNVWLKGSGLPA